MIERGKLARLLREHVRWQFEWNAPFDYAAHALNLRQQLGAGAAD